ncbi:MatE family transporter [Achromobacter aloeverae]|uniref:MatE family transporter n=1 Tax=Achromobacter aloeverae TaxID=1750518 RepID=A0A4V1MSI0_9BURK|nr:MatE family transporter [Achromobacter aloeverae]
MADAASGIPPGHGNRSLGPSDSSDSGSDLGADAPDTDTDAVGTGERADVENDQGDGRSRDIGIDRVVNDDGAGLAHTRPDPARNGG